MTGYGVATVGVGPGTTSWTGAAVGVSHAPQSASLNINAQEGYVRDGDGKIIAGNFTAQERELTIDVIPNHATDASTFAPPAPGTVVTLAAFELDTLNGDWNVKSGVACQMNNTPDGRLRVTIPLIQPADSDALDPV